MTGLADTRLTSEVIQACRSAPDVDAADWDGSDPYRLMSYPPRGTSSPIRSDPPREASDEHATTSSVKDRV
jgi:hypothetical protein